MIFMEGIHGFISQYDFLMLYEDVAGSVHEKPLGTVTDVSLNLERMTHFQPRDVTRGGSRPDQEFISGCTNLLWYILGSTIWNMRSTHFLGVQLCLFQTKKNILWFAKLSLLNPPMVSNCNLSQKGIGLREKNITTLHLEFHTCTSEILVVAGWKKDTPRISSSL